MENLINKKFNFFYITKRFLEICPNNRNIKLSDFPFIKTIEDDENSEICYMDLNNIVEKNYDIFFEYLDSIKSLIKEKYLALILYNAKDFENIKKISKYFKETFYFSELWLSIENIIKLHKIDRRYISLFPVATNVNFKIIPCSDLQKLPNKNIFISLGHGSEDFELIKKVIKSNPDLNFSSPDISFGISKKKKKQGIKFNFQFSNLNIIKSYTDEYIEAFNKCDVVFLPLMNKKLFIEFGMIGGFRLSNALWGKKYIIMTENYVNRIVMAKDNKTCLVVDGKLKDINNAFKRIYSGEFKMDENILNKIRFFMDYQNRVEYIYNYILNYTNEDRFSNEKNFKFEEDYLIFLKKLFLEEGYEISEFCGIKKGTKILNGLIYKIILFEEKNIKKIKIYMLDFKKNEKNIFIITNIKQKNFLLKTNNDYYIFILNKIKIISKEIEDIAKYIKNFIEKYCL